MARGCIARRARRVRAFVSNVSVRVEVQCRLNAAAAKSQRSRAAGIAPATLDIGGHGRPRAGTGCPVDGTEARPPRDSHERSKTMTKRSSKSQGSPSKGSQSSMSNRTDTSPSSDTQSCPSPSEPRRDTSISSDDEEEE
jgi:hypothetical protein